MYRRILVALDGSAFAEQVLAHVEALATTFGSAVTLVRAITPDRSFVHPPVNMLPANSPLPASIPMVEAERHAASSYLAEVAQQLSRQNVTVASEVVPGAAAEVIVQVAGQVQADLIAMTTHGVGCHGRVSAGVWRTASCAGLWRLPPSSACLVRRTTPVIR